mmetsp:Transcript_4739/g.9058  ORF Transcript_4739/g.9058 Transcript_4739/m.9058 type:complete len:103 (+) Transcript_4739:2507-2815(+)
MKRSVLSWMLRRRSSEYRRILICQYHRQQEQHFFWQVICISMKNEKKKLIIDRQHKTKDANKGCDPFTTPSTSPRSASKMFLHTHGIQVLKNHINGILHSFF